MSQGMGLQDRHCCISNSSRQSLPPYCGRTMGTLLRCCVPPPHALEHGPHSPHSETWQSIGPGHACVLHALVSSVAGHGWPPKASRFKMDLDRVRVPPPQGFEQSPHALHADTMQSSGGGAGGAGGATSDAGHGRSSCSAGTSQLVILRKTSPMFSKPYFSAATEALLAVTRNLRRTCTVSAVGQGDGLYGSQSVVGQIHMQGIQGNGR
jgi:hypothetical protein